MGLEEEKEKFYLANIEIIQKVNHSTIAAFFNDTPKFMEATNTI